MSTEQDIQSDSIPQLLEHMRDIFLSMLDRSLGSTITAGTCQYAAVFLCESLAHFAPAWRTRVCGGPGGAEGGCRDREGVLRGHYWVEVHLPHGQTGVADITSDQFGYPPVVWMTGSEMHHRYVAGDQALVDEHVAELRTLCDAQDAVADA